MVGKRMLQALYLPSHVKRVKRENPDRIQIRLTLRKQNLPPLLFFQLHVKRVNAVVYVYLGHFQA